jgi:hypothetical protein
VKRKLTPIILLTVAAISISAMAGAAQQVHTGSPSLTWSGTWSSEWGTMVLTQTGSNVKGTYVHDQGHIAGTISGDELIGRWNEAPTRQGPNDAGEVVLTMSADGKSYTGRWNYDGSADTWHTNWNGDCKVGVCLGGAPPTVEALPFTEITKPGATIGLKFSVKDDSGRARVYLNLYDGGRFVKGSNKEGPATGQERVWTVTLADSLKGPLYFCVWAINASGQRTTAYHACKWISMLVPIAEVSNGCGGEGWNSIVAIENYFGNSATYGGHKVVFTEACNLHDAGYGGQTVEDTINGDIVDYHSWSRAQVDTKFKRDMGELCRARIPISAATALRDCEDNIRYSIVRKFGHLFFDANLMEPGVQTTGPRSNG